MTLFISDDSYLIQSRGRVLWCCQGPLHMPGHMVLLPFRAAPWSSLPSLFAPLVLASLLVLKHVKHASSSEPFWLLFCLECSSPSYTLDSSLISIRCFLKCHWKATHWPHTLRATAIISGCHFSSPWCIAAHGTDYHLIPFILFIYYLCSFPRMWTSGAHWCNTCISSGAGCLVGLWMFAEWMDNTWDVLGKQTLDRWEGGLLKRSLGRGNSKFTVSGMEKAQWIGKNKRSSMWMEYRKQKKVGLDELLFSSTVLP